MLARALVLGLVMATAMPLAGCASGQTPDDEETGEGGSGSTGNKGLQGYGYRRPIDIGNAPAGYSLAITFDHAALVAEAKASADGMDVRVAFSDAAGVTELDRVLALTSSWDSDKTTVWFRTVEGEGSYHLYYSNGNAGSPPADASKVFLYFDDFEGALDEGWTVSDIGGAEGGTAEIKAGKLRLSGVSGDVGGQSDSFVFASREVSGDVMVDVALTASGGSLGADAKMGGLMMRQSPTEDSRFQMISVLQTPLSRYSAKRESEGVAATETQLPITEAFPQRFRMTRSGATTSAAYVDTSGVPIGIGDAATLTLSDPFLVGVPLANISGGAGWAETDWIRVRSVVLPEPTSSVGAEESN